MSAEETTEIGSFNDFFQATLAKEILDSNGISSIITGMKMSLVEVHPDSKITLLIGNKDAEQAAQLLESFFSDM